jgi:dipeptidase E
MPGTPFFTWPRPFVKDFLTANVKEVLFIPFAAVTFSFDEYEEKVNDALSSMDISVTGLHRKKDKKAAVEEASAFMVGGGNTFALLSRLYSYHLINSIKKKVLAGIPYVGWSAGANLACPTIMTTNDMPVVQPPSFDALNLVPFQVNPHYHELKFENQGGETRRERLEEFLILNPRKKIIGLPEGMLLQRNGDKLFLKGTGIARLYQSESPIVELKSGDDLSYLLA